MFEIDVLAVSSDTDVGGKKSGDALAIRFTAPDGTLRVIVIDGGYETHGDDLVARIREDYGTDHVDLVISTHPDRDHIAGLVVVLEELDVDEMLVHQPWLHAENVEGFGNLRAIEKLLQAAKDNGVKVTSPFTGLSRFDGALQVLSPTRATYTELVARHLEEQRRTALSATESASASVSLAYRPPIIGAALGPALPFLPIETLTDDGNTGPRNDSSVVVLLQVDGQNLMFTGDAGIPALTAAADRYEAIVGTFSVNPLTFLQGPHHGSHQNVGPSLLDRILGPPAPYGTVVSIISAAKDDPDHPSPKVTNALKRRGCTVAVTHGTSVCYSHLAPQRTGWGPADLLPALDEDDDDV